MSLRASREIAVPFHIGGDGGIAVVTNDADAAVQHIITVIQTMPLERVMRPEFGSPANELLFEPDDEILQAEMVSRLSNALAQYEPSVNIVGLRVVPAELGSGMVSFELAFTIAPRRDVLTANVSVGGGLTNEQGF